MDIGLWVQGVSGRLRLRLRHSVPPVDTARTSVETLWILGAQAELCPFCQHSQEVKAIKNQLPGATINDILPLVPARLVGLTLWKALKPYWGSSGS